ncbi:MAG: hypothetical protein WKF75_14035 [Singulisphaera sp.]
MIGGVVHIMSSPVGYPGTPTPPSCGGWVITVHTPGVEVADNASTALDDLGEPQPDA